MLELVIACMLVALVLPLVVDITANLSRRHTASLNYIEHHKFKGAIDSQFQAQWQSLLPSGCASSNTGTLTIQTKEYAEERISRRALLEHSDWLRASSFGMCRASLPVIQGNMSMPLSCHWKVGHTANISTCSGHYSATVSAVSSSSTTLSIPHSSAVGLSGIVESQDAYYWYLAKGKSGLEALWRTPYISGNSLELWEGVVRLAVYPLIWR